MEAMCRSHKMRVGNITNYDNSGEIKRCLF
jgi:hypothetical protein